MKKTIKLLGILLIALILSSCWDSEDLEELLLVYGLGIDVSRENPDNYYFTIAFPTIIENAPKKKHEFAVEAPSLAHAQGSLQQKVYRNISYNSVKVLLFCEESARKGILIHIDPLLREPLFRGSIRFAVAIDRADYILSMDPPVSLFATTFIYDSIEQSHNATKVPLTTLRNFVNQYYTTGIEPSMPFLCFGKDKNELNINCIALFKGDKMIHKISDDDSRSFMFLKGYINQGTITFNYSSDNSENEEFVSIMLKGGKSKIKAKLINSQLHIFHDISIQANLAEYTKQDDLLKEGKIKELEDYLCSRIKEDLEVTLKLLQKDLENDNIGYGKYVKADLPEFFDSENWNEQFSDATIHLNTSVKIRSIGVAP